jgi:hypothetical protein
VAASAGRAGVSGTVAHRPIRGSTISVSMGARQRILGVVLAVCALMCVLPAYAAASDTESSMMIDDNQLIYSTAAHTTAVMNQLKEMGVDAVKVSVVWSLIAPDPDSSTKPAFDATDPASYPAASWARYDLIDRTAASLRMQVYFQLMPPDPAWARAAGPSEGPSLGHDPIQTDWEQFVEAVGKRYSGSYTPPATASSSGSGSGASSGLPTVLGIPLVRDATLTASNATGRTANTVHAADTSATSGTAAAAGPLPAVTNWEIWNEPNERSWLNPWYRKQGRTKIYTQPELYRSLVDGAWGALQSTGHSGNTILIGETANEGTLDPLPFVRDLYCVNSSNLPLRGHAALAAGCPQSETPAKFVVANPGLFGATGYAHHPYAFDIPPNKAYPQRYYITLQNISTLENNLNQIYGAYGRRPSGGVPLYLTEWGYESDPPDPFSHTTLGEQETYLNEGEYMTWQDPYVRSLAQFELVDDGPKPDTKAGSRAYWSTFQTGLEYADGSQKPSYDAWELPIWVPHPHHGSSVTVWAQLRPADHTTIQYAVLQYASGGSTNYTTLSEVSTTSPEGFLVTHVRIPASGSVRIAFLDSYTGAVTYSRTVAIS